MRYTWLILLVLIGGCKPVETIVEPKPAPEVPTAGFNPPSHFPAPTYDFASNPLNSKKFQLGRMLFYDPILSRDSCISCATCHQQARAFAPLNHQFGHGIDGRAGTRNVPGMFNMAWSPSFMWDGGIVNLEMQALAPINNPDEMGDNLAHVLQKLNRSALYRPKFKEAFGKDSIDSQQMLKALAQFSVRIISGTSKYDDYVQGKASLSSDELQGLTLVRTKCNECHSGELFTDFQFRNIGLDSTSLYVSDLGRELITQLPMDRRRFKTPTLRNVAITKPYFHDGRVSDLHEAIMAHGEKDAPNIDPILKGNPFQLTKAEVDKIYLFIVTLSDNKMLLDPAFSIKASDYAPYPITPASNCDYVH